MSPKSLFAFSALALASSAVLAQASSVQLYGIVDVALRSESTVAAGTRGDHVKSAAPGGMSQSRLGINVNEDLGDGWRASLNMEHRFMSDTGAQTSANDFWRQAWVGLTTPVGRVTLGRQYNILFDLTSTTFAAYKYSPYIEQFKPELGVALGARQSNMVKYTLVQGGLMAQAQVSAGEATGDRTTGAVGRYQMGDVAVGAGYLTSKDPAGKQAKATVFGAGYTSGPLYANIAYGKNKFDAGFNTTLLVGYSTALVSPATPANQILSPIAFDVKDRVLKTAGFTYQITPQFNLGAQYYTLTQTHRSTAAKSKADMFSTVGQYALSKRTDVYVEYDRIKISGSSPTTFANGMRSRTGYMAGVRHRF